MTCIDAGNIVIIFNSYSCWKQKELFEILINASGVSGGGQLAAALTNCLFQTDLFEERLDVKGFKEFIKA